MPEPDCIHRYAEHLPGGRAVLRQDVVIDGKLVPEMSHVLGSPAPLATVKAHEGVTVLGHTTTEEN